MHCHHIELSSIVNISWQKPATGVDAPRDDGHFISHLILPFKGPPLPPGPLSLGADNPNGMICNLIPAMGIGRVGGCKASPSW